jgi:hypothetical protein
LPQLIAFMEALPVLRELMPHPLQVRLVADANRIHAELRWRLRKRRHPDHRSAIHESIEAGVAVFLAPEHVKQEIEKYYEAIAADTGTTVAEVEKEWTNFQQYVGFYAPQERPSSSETYADIKDFPYVATWREVDAQAVYTADPHLAAMGAAVVSVFIDTQLRDYARASTVQIAVRIGSSLSVFVGWEFFCAMFRLLVQLIHVIRRLPPAAQAALVAAVTMAVLHPKGREAIWKGWNSLKSSAAAATLRDALVELSMQATEAEEKARSNFERLQAVLPARQKRPLVQHARSVCIAARSALALDELERRIRHGGYETRSRTFRQYLRRVLSSDELFIQVVPGQWAVRATQARPYELSEATRHRAASRLQVEPSTGV